MFSDWKVSGKEYIPPFGPLLIVANHQSNLDPSLLAASLPRKLKFLAKSELFRSPLGNWFLRSFGAFPLNRQGVDVRAYRWVLEQLEQGKVVVLFPEGTRSKSGMRKALPGIAQIALKAEVPILPVGISGTAHMGTYLRVFNPTGRLRVNVGPLFTLPEVEGKPNKEVLESFTEMIMLRIASLLPESERGVYNMKQDRIAVTQDSGSVN